jgi:hypothetical protein
MRASPVAKSAGGSGFESAPFSFGAAVSNQAAAPRSFLTPSDKVGPAAAVHPNATSVIAPGLPLDAGRTAPLLRELHPPAGVCRAVIALAIIRRAGDGRAIARSARSRPARSIPRSQVEVGSATAVNPNPGAAITPGLPLDAGRTAALVSHLYSAAGIHPAQMSFPVIGRARHLPPVLLSNPALRPRSR